MGDENGSFLFVYILCENFRLLVDARLCWLTNVIFIGPWRVVILRRKLEVDRNNSIFQVILITKTMKRFQQPPKESSELTKLK